jgi:hypothetical protein
VIPVDFETISHSAVERPMRHTLESSVSTRKNELVELALDAIGTPALMYAIPDAEIPSSM